MAFNLPPVDRSGIPESWLKNPLPLSKEAVKVYRGFASDARKHSMRVVNEVAQGGILSRDPVAAHDAIFNQYGRDPELQNADKLAGVIEITIPAALWNELVSKLNIVERTYPGFSRRINSSEIRVNTSRAGELIDQCPKRIIRPDARYDFRLVYR